MDAGAGEILTASSRAHARAVVLALIVTVLWSSSWVIIRFGLDDEGLSPITFAGLRYGCAAVILMVAVMTRPRLRAATRQVQRADLRQLLGLGIIFYSVTQGAQFVALDHQPAATTSLALSMTPLLVALVARRSIHEPATPSQVVGAVLVLLGSAAYLSGSLGATAIGMTAALLALGANVWSSVLGRAVNRTMHLPPIIVTMVSMALGAAVMLVVGAAVEGVPTLSGRAALIILWLAVVNTALAFTLWNASLQHLPATESAVINNTMLVQIAALAWMFLGEVPSAIQLVGIGAVTAGIIWSQTR